MCSCISSCIDKMFLGHFVRPLFSKENDPTTVRDGLTNTVTTAGVVAALVLSMVLEPAMSSTTETNWAIAASLCWYSAAFAAGSSVCVSTLGAVVLAITAEKQIMVMGRRLLYAWSIPFEFTFGSVGMMFVGCWLQAENQREIFLATSFNITGTEAFLLFEKGGLVIWVIRLFISTAMFVSFILTVVMMCCGERIEQLSGIESTSHKEEKSTAVTPAATANSKGGD